MTSVTKENVVVADVLTCTVDGHDKYWVQFTCPTLPRWTTTYYGKVGKKGRTTVKHDQYDHDTIRREKNWKGYRPVARVTFHFPEKLLRSSASTNTSTGSGGYSVTSTDLLLEAFFKNFQHKTGQAPPCGSVAKKLFTTDPDAFRKAAHMEPLGFDPHNQELYEAELDMWETYTLLVD